MASSPEETRDVAPRARPHGGGTKKVIGAVVGILGVGALAGGIGFHLLRESRAQQFNTGCSFDPNGQIRNGSASNCQQLYDNIQQARDFAIAGYVAAPVLLGLGAYLLLSSSSDDGDTAATQGRRFACAPSGGLGVSCGGRF